MMQYNNVPYKRIYKRFNEGKRRWEEYNPSVAVVSNPEEVPFNLLCKKNRRPNKGTTKYIEVRSPCLLEVLRKCLRFVMTIPDGYSSDYYESEDDDDDDNDNYEKSKSVEVDAKAVLGHHSLLATEISSMKAQLADYQKIKSTDIVEGDDVDMETISSCQARLSRQIAYLEALLNCLNIEFALTKKKFFDLYSQGEISYNLLWCLFTEDTVVIFNDPKSDLIMAGRVVHWEYIEHSRKFFRVSVRYIDSNGTTLHYSRDTLEIFHFENLVKIKSLPVQPLQNDELQEKLTIRGRKFVELLGKHYLEYHDYLIVPGGSGELLRIDAEGRAMVDCISYCKMNHKGNGYQPSDEETIQEILEEELKFCASTVRGYSFVRKRWGRFVVDKFTPVVWRREALDHLVLPETTKYLIHSLVSADRKDVNVISDVISGKGGGCIIVLHGRPGTGKTLTAEAMAEQQEKPLMTVSAGELGDTANEVEKKLKEILGLAALWDAVLLLDEADIFLEKRSLHEINRNAMVGVFLRLLEYHQRVMFLTTNRITTIDEAFKSRISIAVKYDDLDESARKAIWIKFLALADVAIVEIKRNEISCVTNEELDKLSLKPLNGREIKNTTRTAQSLAVSMKRLLCYDLILNVLDIVEKFDEDFNEEKS